jgi:hypothetical protein
LFRLLCPLLLSSIIFANAFGFFLLPYSSHLKTVIFTSFAAKLSGRQWNR